MNLPLEFTQDPRVLDLMKDLQLSFKRYNKNYKNKRQIIVKELTDGNDVYL